MFLGDFKYSLDDKSRVVLPATLRRGIAEEELRDRFYLVPSDEDECLEFHPKSSWESYIAGLRSRDDHTDREWREFLRDLYSSACEVQLDKQYRFVVPEASKNAAGIKEDIYFVGLGEFIELWSKSRWEKRLEARAGKRKVPRKATSQPND